MGVSEKSQELRDQIIKGIVYGYSMSVLQRNISADTYMLHDSRYGYDKLSRMERRIFSDTSGLVAKQRLDRGCAMENTLCMDLLRKHNTFPANLSGEYFEDDDVLSKKINLNVVTNCNQKVNIRRAFSPINNGNNFSLLCNSRKNIPAQSDKILNRDKQCNMNFDLQENDRISCLTTSCESSPVLHRRFGRRLVVSKSVDRINKTDLSTIEEVSVLQPRKPTDSSPNISHRNLPEIKPPMVKRHSFPPTQLPISMDNTTKIVKDNNSSLPDVDVHRYNTKFSRRGDRIVDSPRATYSDDEFETVSDNEEEIISSSQKKENNEKIYRYLDNLEPMENEL